MAAPVPPPQAPPGMLRGMVKQVLSGDTLVVQGLDSSRGPPPEKQVTLAYLSAPRLGNRNQPDAPFAWPAREFLRGWLIGKQVNFSVDYANQQGRQFGTVTTDDGTSVSQVVVAEGWARVFAPRPQEGAPAPADPSGVIEHLTQLEAGARAEGKGMWNEEPGAAAAATRHVDYSPDPNALVAALGGERVTAVVEHVSSGSGLKVLLLPGFQHVTLLLAGVVTPSVRRNLETGAEDAQPFARESRTFTESRVLHRTVRAHVGGVDKQGNLVGSVFHVTHEINLGVELIKAGLAKVADWSAHMTPSAAQLREAERLAKAARANLWHGYQPPTAAPGMSEYQARVVEVVGADVLVVAAGAPGAQPDERRVYLSSIRAPRAGNERRGDAGEPYAYDGKEWLRKAAVGKKVRVVPEYRRTLEAREAGASGAAMPEVERTYAAVFVGDKNLAVGLIAQGFATVNTFGRSEERSAHFDELVEAETSAKERKAGLHSGRTSQLLTPSQCQDLTLPANRDRARAFLPALQRDSRVRATVLHVVHGARFKLLVPKESCIISLALAGVRCPATARRDQPGSVSEPYAEEALALARASLLQREVDIEVESLDKNGVLLGFVHVIEGKKNFAITLLEQGLARRIPPAADRTKHAIALEAAERGAVEARLRVWENYEEEAGPDPAEEEAKAAAEAAASAGAAGVAAAIARLPEMDLLGTDVSDGATFYAQPCGANDSAPRDASRIQDALRSAASAPALTAMPKAGSLCAALFSADKSFYRAKVTGVQGDKVAVNFIDYGNSATVGLKECRALDPALNATAIPPLALLCKLSYVKASPPEDDEGTECALALSEAVLGRMVRARVDKRQGHELSVTVLLPEATGGSGSGASAPANGDADGAKPTPSPAANTLNADLVEQGLARVERRPALLNPATMPVVNALRSLQDQAKSARLGIWRHGDIEDDDAPEFGYTPRPTDNAWGKKK